VEAEVESARAPWAASASRSRELKSISATKTR
jgi:hypothetical protein